MGNLPNISDEICQATKYWAKFTEGIRDKAYPLEAKYIEQLVRDWLDIQLDIGLRKYYHEVQSSARK
jgi:hypothetical protein